MKTIGAENHHHWQVDVGHFHRDDFVNRVQWSKTGFGCLVHPRIVLTTLDAWNAASNDWRRRDEVSIRIGSETYPCQLGHQEKERNLAALVLAQSACDAENKPYTEFPNVARELPAPGQALGILLEQFLSLENGRDGDGGKFICYAFGTVTLLRGESRLLHGLSGLEWQHTKLFGRAVFDAAGKIYGITTHFLKCNLESVEGVRAQTGYLVFSPLTVELREAAEDSIKLLK
jgi:hypothetical protein